MAAVFIKLYPENPDPRKISQVIDVLQKGGVIIYPTDTVYGMGCDIFNQKAIERIGLIKGVKPKKEHFSFMTSAIFLNTPDHLVLRYLN